jgi:hypothetical protein
MITPARSVARRMYMYPLCLPDWRRRSIFELRHIEEGAGANQLAAVFD